VGLCHEDVSRLGPYAAASLATVGEAANSQDKTTDKTPASFHNVLNHVG